MGRSRKMSSVKRDAKRDAKADTLNLDSAKQLLIRIRELEQQERSGSINGMYGRDTKTLTLEEMN